MPKSLRIAFRFLGLTTVLSVLTASWITLGFNVLMAAALLNGHEGVRPFIWWASRLGIYQYVVASLYWGVYAVEMELTLMVLLNGCLMFVASLQSGWIHHVCEEWDLQQWMYARSTGGERIED